MPMLDFRFPARPHPLLEQAWPDYFGGGGGGGASSQDSLKIWDGKSSFDITKAVSFHGFLFARPESPLSKNEVIPSLPYFNKDSGKNFNFSCVGYKVNETSSAPVATINGAKWDFDVDLFVETKQKFQSATKWVYSGGVDLILCNQIVDVNSGACWHEMKSSVCVSVDELISKQYARSFEAFFQNIVNFANRYEGSRPAWDYSDAQGLRLSGETLREVIVSFIPAPFRKSLQTAEHFAIRNIAK